MVDRAAVRHSVYRAVLGIYRSGISRADQREFGWNRTAISLGFTIAALLVGAEPVVGLAVSCSVKGVRSSAHLLPLRTHFAAHQVLWQCRHHHHGGGPRQCQHGAQPDHHSHWFEKAGHGVGIIMTGIGLGGMVMVFVASAANDAHGWRCAYRLLGMRSSHCRAGYHVRPNRPQDMGRRPTASRHGTEGLSVH